MSFDKMAPDAARGIENAVKGIVAQCLGVASKEVINEADLTRDLGAGLPDIIRLISGLEGEFDIIIPYKDVEGMKTVAQAIKCVARLVASSSSNYSNQKRI